MDNTAKVFVAIGVAVGTVAILSRATARYDVFEVAAFVDPLDPEIQEIAAALPAGRDAFILSAWEIAGEKLQYRPFGSFLYFDDGFLQSQSVTTPAEVLHQGASNCVGKAQVLTSLLRTRMSPQDVYIAIGELRKDGVGGHAWVTVNRDGTWYRLEATVPPPASPWVSVADSEQAYVADAYVNDSGLVCLDGDVCREIHTAHVKVSGCSCQRRQRRG